MANQGVLKIGHEDFTFDLRRVDAASAAALLQQFVQVGSWVEGVEAKDLKLGLKKQIKITDETTLVEYVEAGGKLFDYMVWFAFGKPEDPKPFVDPDSDEKTIPGLGEIAKAVFFNYFFILTMARYPPIPKDNEAVHTPKFLTTIMGLTKGHAYYRDLICSFALEKFGMKWVRYIQFADLGDEAINRFGLGVAGYRMFAPFKLLIPAGDKPSPDPPFTGPGVALTPAQNATHAHAVHLHTLAVQKLRQHREAVTWATRIAKDALNWEIHPVTRNPDLLQNRGSLNENLGNLMLTVFDEADLQQLVDLRILYQMPKMTPARLEWKTWDNNWSPDPRNAIFQEKS